MVASTTNTARQGVTFGPLFFVACWLLLSTLGTAISGFEIQMVGSKSAARIYSVLGQAFNLDVPQHRLAYAPLGSSEGTCRIKFANGTIPCTDRQEPRFIDVAAVTDTIYTAADYLAAPDLQLLPAFAIAVVPIFNLPGASDLNLPRTVLADIFRRCQTGTVCPPGWIEDWNDPRIIAANPQIDPAVLTAAGKITVVVRSDGSGTTEIFKRAMAQFSSSFLTQVGQARQAVWNNVTVVKAYSNQGVAAQVKVTPGSVGYVTLEEATVSEVRIAGLGISVLGEREILRATQLSSTNAVFERGLNFGNNGNTRNRLTADLVGSIGSEAWPIMGYNYLGVRLNETTPGRSCLDRFATYTFLEWFYRSPVSAQVVASLGFVPLPDVARDLILSNVRAKFRCVGQQYFGQYDLPNVELGVTPNLVNIVAKAPAAVSRALNLFVKSYRTGKSGFARVAVVDEADTSVNASLVITDDVSSADPTSKLVLDFAAASWGAIYNFCDLGFKDPCNIISLVLTPSVLCDIVSRRITNWRDSRIMDIQENVTHAQLVLPNATIYLVGYTASAPERITFNRILSRFCTAPADLSQADLAVGDMVDATAAVGVYRYSLTYGPVFFTEESLITQVARMRNGTRIFNSLNCSSEALGEDCWPLVQRYSMVMPSSYSSSECTLRSAQETTLFADYVYDAIDDQTADPLFQFGMSRLDPASQRTKMHNLECFGMSILNPVEDKQLIQSGSIWGARILAIIAIVVFLGVMVWLFRNKSHMVIKTSQVVFSYQILLGFIFQLSAVFAITIQDDTVTSQASLDSSCMATVWLVAIGFVIVYIALAVKAYRVWLIFDNPRLKKFKFRNSELLAKEAVVIMPVILMLVLWTAIAPFKYIRKPVIIDESTGMVRSSVGLYLAWKNRYVPSEFSEGAHVSTALLLNFELVLLLIPVLVLVSENAEATFIVKIIAIFLITCLTAAVFFGPKILMVSGIWHASENVLNSSKKGARDNSSSRDALASKTATPAAQNRNLGSSKEDMFSYTAGSIITGAMIHSESAKVASAQL